ncbi:MAG: NAD(P)-dependent oxidoreductase [Armatimonadota bacterium]
MDQPSVGIIGFGMIGRRFSEKILAAGLELTVYEIAAEKLAAAVELGAQAAASAREATERSDQVLLCLPGSPEVEAAMNGPDGILQGVGEGKLIIDTGTTRPSTDIEYAAKVRERGGRMVDAPLTGRAPGPIMMVGGSDEDFREAEKLLKIVAYKVVHAGPLGHGQRLKLVNQFILAGRLSVFAEAVNMAQRLGLSREMVTEALEFGEAQALIERRFSVPGGQLLALHTKDLGYLSELIEEEDVYAPLTKVVTEAFRETRSRAEPDWSQPSVMTHWETQQGA